MTKRHFVFGDNVAHKYNPQKSHGVIIAADQGMSFVKWHDKLNAELMGTDDLLLLPHPDTVRLDWLADPGNSIGNVILPAECVEANIDNMRAAIDMAMRLDFEQQAGAQA